MRDAVVQRNRAVISGGGLYVADDSDVTVEGCTQVLNNSAARGGGMAVGK